MTELGEIPTEWKVNTLGEISLGKGEYGIGASATEYMEGMPRYLRITDIGDNCRILFNDIKGLDDENYKRYILKYGDIVFARTGNTTGKGYVYEEKDGELVYAGFLIKFSINNKIAKSKFIKYIIQSKRYWDWVGVMSTRSGQPGINSNEYSSFNIQIPPIEEQEKIASILSTVDEQIDNVDELIEKNKELKKGLMQQLLTKGIAHTKFKKTEIGEIPEEWEVRKIGDICDVRGGKRLPKGYQLEDENNGFPYIRVADMCMGGVKLSEIKYVPEDAVEKIKNYKISKDDLFISVAGTLGIVGKIPEELDGANLTENADKLCNIKIDKLYLMKVLQSELVQSIIDSEKTTNAQPKLALTRIKEFLIPVPNNEEQMKISMILSEIDDKIEEYENKKTKIEELKKGLMQRLLTGKIRV